MLEMLGALGPPVTTLWNVTPVGTADAKVCSACRSLHFMLSEWKEPVRTPWEKQNAPSAHGCHFQTMYLGLLRPTLESRDTLRCQRLAG